MTSPVDITTVGIKNKTYFEPNTHHLVLADLVAQSVVLFLAVLSNACLLALESKIWMQRRRLSQPRLLIILLALTDLIGCLFGILPRLVMAKTTVGLTSSQMFLMTRFVTSSFNNLSKMTVVLMAVERFISIRAPFFYVRNCTIKCFCVIQVVLVIYSVFIGILSVIIDWQLLKAMMYLLQDPESVQTNELFLSFEFEIYPSRTTIEWSYKPFANAFTVYNIMQDFALIVILVICNSSVILGLRGMEKRLQETCPRASDARANTADLLTATGKEFARLMVAINIVVVLLTLPQMVRNLCNHFDAYHSEMADFVCQRVALCHAFVNPFLYGLLRRKLRRNFRMFLSKCCFRCRPNDISPMELTRATDSQLRLPK